MKSAFLFVVLVCLVSVLTACDLNAPIGEAGGVFKSSTNATKYAFYSCSDSDGGRNYYASGTVSGNVAGAKYSQQDKCSNAVVLSENYCSSNKRAVLTFNCTYGCLNGACKNTTTPVKNATCTDSDTGLDYNVKGSVTVINGTANNYTYPDRCSGSQLIELFCSGIYPDAQTVNCSSGCSNGACITSLPDLLVASISYNKNTTAEGSPVGFTADIVNYGDTDSGVFNLKWFVDGVQVGYGSHASIKAKASGISEFIWTAVAGIHNVTFLVDADNHVKESNEYNNQKSIGVVIVSKTNSTV